MRPAFEARLMVLLEAADPYMRPVLGLVSCMGTLALIALFFRQTVHYDGPLREMSAHIALLAYK